MAAVQAPVVSVVRSMVQGRRSQGNRNTVLVGCTSTARPPAACSFWHGDNAQPPDRGHGREHVGMGQRQKREDLWCLNQRNCFLAASNQACHFAE